MAVANIIKSIFKIFERLSIVMSNVKDEI